MTNVSIIVPVYNVEKYLAKCLLSLIKQTLKDIEIICIDDGSSDNSAKILKTFSEKDKRIKVLTQQNMGQSVARNKGMKFAIGEYLGFVDSDDWVDKNYFETLYNSAKKYDADIACAGYRRCRYGNGTIRKKFILPQLTDDINKKIAIDNIPTDNYIWNKIYKRDKWLQTGIIFPEGKAYEDIAILVKIMNSLGNMVTVPNTYYHYRKRKSSTVASKDIFLKKDYDWAVNELQTYAEQNNIKLKPINKLKRKKYIRIFNITFLKIYYSNKTIRYNLFGFIPFIKISIC